MRECAEDCIEEERPKHASPSRHSLLRSLSEDADLRQRRDAQSYLTSVRPLIIYHSVREDDVYDFFADAESSYASRIVMIRMKIDMLSIDLDLG